MPPNLNSSRVTTDPSISGSSVARSIARFSRSAAKVSLPGFTELGDLAKTLVEDWKEANHNESEILELASRVKGIYSLICDFDTTDHPDLSEASRSLHEIQNLLAEKLEHQSHSGILGAEQKQRLLDSLRLEVDRIVEITHLRLALVQARPNPLDNFRVISAHEIADKSVVYERDPRPESEGAHELALYERRRDSVGAVWRGQLGKASVIYKTYHSCSKGGAAAKVAEKDLKYLSRCLHPNIGSVIGITKGYDGLNGYAVVTSGIPLEQFIRRVNSGTSLVECIRGLECANLAAEEIFKHYSIEANETTVEPDGHLTASPMLSSKPGILSSPALESYSISNPASALVLQIRRTHPQRSYLSTFLSEVAALGWHMFTTLEVERLAAKHKLLPVTSGSCRKNTGVPLFTIGLGHLGYVVGQEGEGFWTVGKLELSTAWYFGYDCSCNQNRGPYRGRHARRDGWTRVILCDCRSGQFFWWATMYSWDIYEKASQGRVYLRNCGMEVDGALMCTDVKSKVTLRQIGSIKHPHKPLFYYCDPYMYTDPRAFWGFLSTSDDPCSPGIDPAEVGLELAYDIEYRAVHLSDSCDYKYKKLLQSGLASIPGGYPGSYVEEVEEDEAD